MRDELNTHLAHRTGRRFTVLALLACKRLFVVAPNKLQLIRSNRSCLFIRQIYLLLIPDLIVKLCALYPFHTSYFPCDRKNGTRSNKIDRKDNKFEHNHNLQIFNLAKKKNQRIIFITNCYSTEILCRRVERYHQRGNLNLQTEDRQTTPWRKEEGQTTINKTLHRKPTDRATQTPLKTGYELICS